MSLSNQLEQKFNQIQIKLEKVKTAFTYNTELVTRSLKELDPRNPIRNDFAKYNFTLENILNAVNDLLSNFNVYLRYKEIILLKEKRISKALTLLETFEDEVTYILTDLQAIAIYLENLKK